MREIKKDTRAYDRMIAQGKSYKSISDALVWQGVNVDARTVYRYITNRAVPSKHMQKAIAKVLNCSVKEIF